MLPCLPLLYLWNKDERKIAKARTWKRFIFLMVDILDLYVCMQFGILLMWLWCGICFLGNNNRRFAGVLKHMNTIYQNKSNTNSSTFNMKHISELVDVYFYPLKRISCGNYGNTLDRTRSFYDVVQEHKKRYQGALVGKLKVAKAE